MPSRPRSSGISLGLRRLRAPCKPPSKSASMDRAISSRMKRPAYAPATASSSPSRNRCKTHCLSLNATGRRKTFARFVPREPREAKPFTRHNISNDRVAPADRIWECECYCVVFCRCRSFSGYRLASAANDPFVGKWKVNPSKSTLIDEMKVEAQEETNTPSPLAPAKWTRSWPMGVTSRL